SRLQQPAREIRLEGEIWALRPARTSRQRLDIAFREAFAPRDLGPLRVWGETRSAADGGPALTIVCEWDLPNDPADQLPIGRAGGAGSNRGAADGPGRFRCGSGSSRSTGAGGPAGRRPPPPARRRARRRDALPPAPAGWARGGGRRGGRGAGPSKCRRLGRLA